MQIKRILPTLTGVLLGAVSAASPGSAAPAGPHSGPGVPLSVLEMMRAAIEIPADGLWAAQGAEKLTDEDWLLVEQDAIQLIGASSLVAHAGTGKNDAKWELNADWQAWVRDMQKTAVDLRAAAKTKDAGKLGTAADHLQEVCSGCHAKYRPSEPSDGVSRYPYYPKRELAK